MAQNLVRLLRESCARHGRRALFGERLEAGWRWTTYEQFERGVVSYAEQLGELGVQAGDRVVVTGPWSLTGAQLAHAVCRQRGSFLPLSSRRELDAWRFILRHAEPRLVVIGDREDRLVLEALRREQRAPWSVVELRDTAAASGSPALPEREPDPEQAASLCYQRRAWGSFAPSVWTHRALCRQALSLQHTSDMLQRTLSDVLLLRAVFAAA